jgi:fatty acid desaturase
MTAKQYADRIAPRLPPEVFRPVPGRVLWLLVHGLIVAACTTGIVDAHLGTIGRLGLGCVIGISFTRIGILGHEILHGSVVGPPWQRRLLGSVCLAPMGIGCAFWIIWHSIHHANTQHPVRDPDTWGTLGSVPVDRTMVWLRRLTNPRPLLFPLLLATGMTAHSTALLFCMQKQMTRKQRVGTLAELPRIAQVLKETWPDRYHHLPQGRALLAVWRTPRVYQDPVHLVDTSSHALYGTLGHGLELESRSQPSPGVRPGLQRQ